jgi:hypothetical protein
MVPVSTVRYLLVLAVALVISAQVLMLMERGRPLDKRLRDLSWGGDASSLLLVAMLTVGASATVIGSLLGRPAIGGATGLVLALVIWTAAVVWAHRQSQLGPRHGGRKR